LKDKVSYIDIEYPRVEGNINCIKVGLSDVRAADSIRIKYDFDRDGWVIEQASIFQWEVDDFVCDEDWKEVSFIQAWQRKKEEVS
jgi:hypothetical protein